MSLYLGTKLALAGEMKNEMSQSGFSAVFHKVSKVNYKLKSFFFCTFQAQKFESLISELTFVIAECGISETFPLYQSIFKISDK